MSTGGVNIVAVSVGNTRTAIGLFEEGELRRAERSMSSEEEAVNAVIRQAWEELESQDGAAIVVASVNDRVADGLQRTARKFAGEDVYRAEVDFAVPIGRRLDVDAKPGVDRLLNAAGAWSRVKQACIVIDAGTAVTVDFVDGEGTFHGGAIGPGATMQLQALHERTAALPEVRFGKPEEGAFGRNTKQAMLQGVYYGLQGMVRRLVENYAEAYGAFPMVIATGGDAETLFSGDELVDRIVPELTLLGLAETARVHLMAPASGETEHGPD